MAFFHRPVDQDLKGTLSVANPSGRNLGVRLPAAVAREAHLHVDQRVRVSVEGDHVVITPVDASRLTLEQRLAAYDPRRHGGEQMATTKALGAERW